ncbi:putative disease resistance protein RGA4 [Triticum dicoccoides]|uniref:putative disease resistance protein RGA4 n=1 Tax=Triticum dicoccoides TaxID=85692 RepID=UPI00188E9C1B|nr:putative disease resistance protein RGA4 [Triticum dicoccoides]
MSLSTFGIISAINECVNLFQSAKSAISSLRSRWSSSHEQSLQDHVLQLQSDLQRLCNSLPAMYDLINGAEWRSYEERVAKLLPSLKDAVSEAEDLIDEFRWYEMKVQVEGNASQSPFIDFLDSVTHGNFNKLNDIQLSLNHLSGQMENMGLRGVTQRFDKVVRPETTSLLSKETKIYGRDKELKEVLGFLNVPICPKRKRATSPMNASTSTSSSNHVNSELTILSLPVLVITGIGGVGKTTLAQHICSHQQVKSHFELIIWICVSDNFDVKRLTKEVIQSWSVNEAKNDNLDSLQRALSNHLNNKRLLIVLDDMWDDALKVNGQWELFCAPFTSVQEGSAMLVTTRCPNVAGGVQTMEPIILEGLKDDAFWNFFKSCAFGSMGCNNDPELERIGRRILPKLKGSPLGAKTLGRMLSMDLQESHWNFILESELWELKQKETDILPALRLSYIYLPLYLKQCFAFCVVYPKDYNFQKEYLAEIWVAEGFVEPHGGIPIQDIGCQYFDDLVARSFFQKLSYRIVLATGSIFGTLKSLKIVLYAKRCKLESLPCDFDRLSYSAGGRTHLNSEDGQRHGFGLLKNLNQFRGHLVIYNIGIISKHHAVEVELKNKKYLDKLKLNMWDMHDTHDALGFHNFNVRDTEIKEVLEVLQPPITLKYLSLENYAGISLPSWFQPQNLPNLKSLNFAACVGIESILSPMISQSVNLHEIPVVAIFMSLTDITFDGCESILSLNHFLLPDYVPAIKTITIERCKMLASIPTEVFGGFHFLEELWIASCPNMRLQRLVSPSLKKLTLWNSSLFCNIDCCSLTYFYLECEFVTSIQLQMWILPALQMLHIECKSLASIGGSPNLSISASTGSIRAFSSLIVLSIRKCQKLSTLDDFLTQKYLPAIVKIELLYCMELLSLPGESFGSFTYLKHLIVNECPSLNWQSGLLFPSSLQRLAFTRSGDISSYVPDCLQNLTSLVSLKIGGLSIRSIPGNIWHNNLATVKELMIEDCPYLVSLGGAKATAKIKVTIYNCPKLRRVHNIC